MTRAFVMVTAMPPTTGHVDLIRFAYGLGMHTTVQVHVREGEPYVEERWASLFQHFSGFNSIDVFKTDVTGIPDTPQQAYSWGWSEDQFWDVWCQILRNDGMQSGDVFVGSETYGIELSKRMGATFIPYDVERSINSVRGTHVRNNTEELFDEMIPEFQRHLRPRVTVFGAESVGKTTLSKSMLDVHRKALWLPEYARPYLETVGGHPLTREKMLNIMIGQYSLQWNAHKIASQERKNVIIQDTDLFSTVGYWRMHEDEFGPVPNELIIRAKEFKSDLYLVPLSNIPFEEDQLRYGGDKREGSDEFWVDILKEFNLPYQVLPSPEYWRRETESYQAIEELMIDRYVNLQYERP